MWYFKWIPLVLTRNAFRNFAILQLFCNIFFSVHFRVAGWIKSLFSLRFNTNKIDSMIFKKSLCESHEYIPGIIRAIFCCKLSFSAGKSANLSYLSHLFS